MVVGGEDAVGRPLREATDEPGRQPVRDEPIDEAEIRERPGELADEPAAGAQIGVEVVERGAERPDVLEDLPAEDEVEAVLELAARAG